MAEARDHFTRLLRDVERGAAIRVTRRGRPVAVLASPRAYERSRPPGRTFWDAYQAWRAWMKREGLPFVEDAFGNVRDRSPGREFSW